MKSKLVLIDADGLCYHSSKETLQESIEIIDEKINNILEKTEATHYSLFISNNPYFRHKIDPLYKASRSKCSSSLKWLKTLKKYLVEGYNANSMYLVEADDLVAYWFNKDLHIADDGKIEPREVFDDALDYCKQEKLDLFHYEPLEVIIASPDKDLLQSIPGKHFNYTYRLEEKDNPGSLIKGWWVETEKKDCMKFQLMQLICGDTTDGIKGIEGKGIKYFEKIYDSIEFYSFDTVLLQYIMTYGNSQGIYEFQKNYRLLHLLDCDRDFEREVGELPELPHINEVVNTQNESLEQDNGF